MRISRGLVATTWTVLAFAYYQNLEVDRHFEVRRWLITAAVAFSIAGLILIAKWKDFFPIMTCTSLAILAIGLSPVVHTRELSDPVPYYFAIAGWFGGVLVNHRKDILRLHAADLASAPDSDKADDED